MRIAIIGAGAAGLAALRHSLQEQHSCEVFEQTGSIGGTWNYTDEIGTDHFGLPVHSSMYQGLRTNLPKELMQFEDFPFRSPERSYVGQSDVLRYIKDYAEQFRLMSYIKFFTTVVRVSPLEHGRWSLDVKDLKLGSIETKTFDAVFVCVGNYKTPFLPAFKGVETFRGATIHSHSFRKTAPFADKRVLIVGSGPSGLDIARLINTVAKKVILSHRSPWNPLNVLPEEILKKPEIREFKEHSVVFNDGTEEDIDNVVFCTGYLYSFPFLSDECKIQVEDKWVKYLYKQIININHPTMAFIGIPYQIFPFVIFGIQVRFFLAYLSGKFTASKNDMMGDLTIYMNQRRDRGIPDSKAHMLSLDQGDYMDDLAATANIQKVPHVFIKMYKYVHSDGKGKMDLSYRIVDENEFEILKNSKIDNYLRVENTP
ncbi:unnamed protein product [Phyllotreta striolata]|uniref:Flavin-containing monooxygenase n=1 Tax=Phyllotreta striolata TaxID=444603 RepID=A0A9N9XLW9_PHYSR|nr:unnamed protein product [Phyllotreta striolata]